MFSVCGIGQASPYTPCAALAHPLGNGHSATGPACTGRALRLRTSLAGRPADASHPDLRPGRAARCGHTATAPAPERHMRLDNIQTARFTYGDMPCVSGYVLPCLLFRRPHPAHFRLSSFSSAQQTEGAISIRFRHLADHISWFLFFVFLQTQF